MPTRIKREQRVVLRRLLADLPEHIPEDDDQLRADLSQFCWTMIRHKQRGWQKAVDVLVDIRGLGASKDRGLHLHFRELRARLLAGNPRPEVDVTPPKAGASGANGA